MTQKAIVVSSQGKLMASLERSEACAQCRACAFGETQTVLVELPKDGQVYREGDTVELTLHDGSVSRASLLAYGFPLLMFLAGLAGGWLLGGALGLSRDLLGALCALLLTGTSLLTLRRLDRRLRRSGRFTPVAHPCCAADDDRT